MIADYLYANYPDADEGELSRLRATLVKGDSLVEIAKGLGLGKYLNLGPGELRSGGHSRGSILADAVEALFAAVYLDGGYAESRQVILSLFEKKFSTLNKKSQQKDPKTRLQELLQSENKPLPNYAIINVSGEQHEQCFKVSCKVAALNMITEGVGSSRKKAEQDAANRFLRLLENV